MRGLFEMMSESNNVTRRVAGIHQNCDAPTYIYIERIYETKRFDCKCPNTRRRVVRSNLPSYVPRKAVQFKCKSSIIAVSPEALFRFFAWHAHFVEFQSIIMRPSKTPFSHTRWMMMHIIDTHNVKAIHTRIKRKCWAAKGKSYYMRMTPRTLIDRINKAANK